MEEIDYKELLEDFIGSLKISDLEKLPPADQELMKNLEIVHVPDFDEKEKQSAVFLQARKGDAVFRFVYAGYDKEEGLYIDQAPNDVYKRIFNLLLTRGISQAAKETLYAIESTQSQQN